MLRVLLPGAGAGQAVLLRSCACVLEASRAAATVALSTSSSNASSSNASTSSTNADEGMRTNSMQHQQPGVQQRSMAAAGSAWQQQQHAGQPWHSRATFATSSSNHSSDSSSSSSTSTSSSGTGGDNSGNPSTLQASMDKLVDSAVGLVEQGRLQQAVEVLQQGISLLESTFPGSPELSELHNQAALLLLFAGQPQPAARHASDALDITSRHFGHTHPLTGHRLLRLGTIKFADGQLQEAQPLLATAADMLSAQPQDSSLSEALFYLHLLALAAADSPAAVAAATPELTGALRNLVTTLGAESMIVRLALTAHSKLVGAALDSGLPTGEAAFKQHIALQELQDPHSAELGLTLYQLATTYYCHDLLADAGPALQRATALLRAHYPQDHDLVVLCKHRLGMICAAGRDHRSAQQLLGETRSHYAGMQAQHPLALEAELGLAMAEIKALDPRLSGVDRTAALSAGLAAMRAAITGMAAALGADHLLVNAGSRYLAQLAVMNGVQVPAAG